MEQGSHPTPEPSLAALLGDIVNDAKDLLVQEVALIKLEVQDELRRTKIAAITLGVGIGVVASGGMLLMLMLVHVLEVFTEIPLWGCYGLTGSGLVVLGTVLLAAGKTKTEELHVVPRRTLETREETAREQRADGSRQDIPADTQGDIEDTRSAMTEKLEMLEERVRETVEDAQSSVEEIVDNVRDTVDTTVAAVKQTVEGAQASVEDVVENVQAEGRRVTEFLGLPWHSDQARFYETAQRKFLFAPTYHDVTQPVYRRAVGRWERYAEALAPVLPKLASYCRSFGYDVE